MTRKTHVLVHSGFEFERNIIFVAPRTSERSFCNYGFICLCLGMLEMQGYYLCIQYKRKTYLLCRVKTFFRVGLTASKMEWLSIANLSAG